MKRIEAIFTRQRTATIFWVVTDILLINIAFVMAYWLRYDLQLFRTVDPAFNVPYRVYWPFVAIFTLLLIFVYKQQGVYQLRRKISWVDELYAIGNGTATGIIIIIVMIFLYRPAFYSRLIFVYAGLLSVVNLGFSRLLKVYAFRWLRRQGVGVRRVLIIGAGEIGRTVMRAVVANPESGFDIIGFLDDNPNKGTTDIGRFKALGNIARLGEILEEEAIDEVIITLPWQYHRKIVSVMAQSERAKVRARIVPDLFQLTLNRMQIEEVAGVPMIGVKDVGISGLNQIIKRSMDVIISTAALIILTPIMGLVALMIKLESPGDVLFRQERVGKNGRRFDLYKFRSMVEGAEEQQSQLQELNEADGPIFKMKDDPRITRLGKWLRRLSFDELPQFYNVLRGDMSLIGPRPPLQSEVDQYQEWHKRRLEISPGITGLWQVSGRSDLTFDEMALLDIYYIENWSLSMDTKIFVQTIPKVLFGAGAY